MSKRDAKVRLKGASSSTPELSPLVPWLKKNPFMSMWLSGLNAAAGSMCGGPRRVDAATAESPD
jgi:hypothetical protein